MGSTLVCLGRYPISMFKKIRLFGLTEFYPVFLLIEGRLRLRISKGIKFFEPGSELSKNDCIN